MPQGMIISWALEGLQAQVLSVRFGGMTQSSAGWFRQNLELGGMGSDSNFWFKLGKYTSPLLAHFPT